MNVLGVKIKLMDVPGLSLNSSPYLQAALFERVQFEQRSLSVLTGKIVGQFFAIVWQASRVGRNVSMRGDFRVDDLHPVLLLAFLGPVVCFVVPV